MESLGSTQVYVDRWMSVREDRVCYPDGSTGTYSVVDSADVALVIPVDGERMQLVELYRYPVGGRRWEFPSGSFDQLDDAPALVAARELREETGLVAGTMMKLGTLETMPSTLNQRCWVFLATDLTQGTHQREPEEQDMRSRWFTRTEVEKMLSGGTIGDAKSAAAYALLLLRGTSSRMGIE